MTDTLYHYGTPRHSGRYPWGSGEDPYQNNVDFLAYVKELAKEGFTETQRAEALGINTKQLRAQISIAGSENRLEDRARAIRLHDKGYTNSSIGKLMGRNESSVRGLLDPVLNERSQMTQNTANMLKENVDKKGFIDIGVGVERHIGISRTKLKTAIAILEEEGYETHKVYIPQVGNPLKKTTMLVLAKPESTYLDVINNQDKIGMIGNYSKDNGRSFLGLDPIKSIDSKRINIRYAEDGGKSKDGVIELRRGVDDISLGNAKYAQVRIGVDDTHFLKGMAIYSDDMPAGVDVIFNTNKSKSVSKMDVMKPMKTNIKGEIDQDNPFGATIKPGGQRESLNIIYEEGDWNKWSKTISSQFLSKQSPALAQRQLDLQYSLKKEEFDEIMSISNPAVKKILLKGLADDADSSSVHLKAAGLPRQAAHVILPVPDMKPNEIYAPKYNNGEKVVLVRHPHGGKFEIPELTVNNRCAPAKKIMEQAVDAVGIHPSVAERLSGADFDGDTVLVIPNSPTIGIKNSAPLKGLADFDPKESYPEVPGMKVMGEKGGGSTGQQMGNISNLITDMTIKGASPDKLIRAVKHSMVVIDAEKHRLNYQESAIQNGIAALKQEYQGGANRGASTLISKAKGETRIGVRDKETWDPVTGKRMYEYKDTSYINSKGQVAEKTAKSTKMFEAEDAFDLSSGTRIESVYATYANNLKALANEARKEYMATKPTDYSASAKVAYQKEVNSLNAQLNIALMNAPLERRAQVLANTKVARQKKDNPDMDYDELKKVSYQALSDARYRVGAKKTAVEISPREWEAIQAGAISNTTLTKILLNTDLDSVKQLATPRTKTGMTPGKLARGKQMLATGYTQAEVASALGVSTTTLMTAIE